MAKYKKKRARELQHDKFRDTAGKIFDRVSDRLEGRGKAILYGLAGIVLIAVLVGVYVKWSHRKSDEARRALGRAIAIATAPVATASPAPGAPAPTYSSEQERAQRAIEEFQKVAAKYGDPYKTEARYFIAANLLFVDRDKAMSELAEVSKAGVAEPASLAKFSLAQAKEADAKYDEAARLYSELAAQNSTVVTPDTANLRLAAVYEKQGKKREAADLLFNIVDASRKSKDSDGAPLPASAAARDATEKLQKLDPDRYAKLTPEAPSGDLPF
ncbi:MAG: tetratricopeptide repeat protein [Pyrinomonadaceae bacterium]